MQALTLEVIQRVIFGSRDPELRDALRARARHDRLDPAADRDVAGAARLGPYGASSRAVERIDELSTTRIDDAGGGDAILDMLEPGHARGAARPARHAARRRPRDDGDRARVGARAARAPPDGRCTTTPQIDAFVKEVLRTRPVLCITARKMLQPYALGDYTLPPGVYVAPCIYLAHRRGRTRSSRSAAACAAASAPRSPRSRCARCCEPSPQRFTLARERAEGERMRRRSVTLAPARGASIIPLTR